METNTNKKDITQFTPLEKANGESKSSDSSLTGFTHPIAKMAFVIWSGLIASGVFYFSASVFTADLEGSNFFIINRNSKNALISQKQKNQEIKVKQASLRLDKEQGTYAVGEKAETAILLDATHVKIAGIDIILYYTPETMQILDITPTPLFDVVPTKEIIEEQGIIRISTLKQGGKFLENGGKLFTIAWVPQSQGVGKFSFGFTEGETDDTNIAEFATGRDVLTSVQNGVYTLSIN